MAVATKVPDTTEEFPTPEQKERAEKWAKDSAQRLKEGIEKYKRENFTERIIPQFPEQRKVPIDPKRPKFFKGKLF